MSIHIDDVYSYHMYGNMYGDHVMERVRRAAEFCDSLQSFFIMHSLGGGTGSGLGSRVITLLHDNFPGVYRYSCTAASIPILIFIYLHPYVLSRSLVATSLTSLAASYPT
jgi:hypothetical protein